MFLQNCPRVAEKFANNVEEGRKISLKREVFERGKYFHFSYEGSQRFMSISKSEVTQSCLVNPNSTPLLKN